jgi:TRAP-type C4-dicarboxylate transport system substrate-binding protein
MKKVIAFAIIFLMLCLTQSLNAGEYTGKAMKSKLATEDLEGDFMTVWSQKFAEEMKSWSDGKIDITVFPYGSLGDTRDINEHCRPRPADPHRGHAARIGLCPDVHPGGQYHHIRPIG